MSIQDLGAIGEFISSIAVVISLVYLAVQIRENTRTQRISSAQDVMSLSATMNTNLLANTQLFDVLTKTVAGGRSLSPEERFQYQGFLRAVFAAHWQVYYLHANGVLDDEIFETYERRTRDILSRPLAMEWWLASKFLFGANYQQYVDRLISVAA
jgi:hypothetical protein